MESKLTIYVCDQREQLKYKRRELQAEEFEHKLSTVNRTTETAAEYAKMVKPKKE
jgi:hypothetical protein